MAQDATHLPATPSSDVATVTSPVATTVATGVPTPINANSAAAVPAGQPITAATPAPAAAATAPAVSIPVAALAPAAAVPAVAGNGSLRDKATEAAAATLTALLPRLAASDTVPVMDRSTTLAGDLSRLLSHYNLAGAAAAAGGQADVGKVQSVLQSALALLGTPYRWGGSDPDSGLDCSGLVGYVFRTALGVDLPRVSRDMAADGEGELIRNRDQLRQGDLVFFGARGRVNHVGIYVGEGRFLHSPSTGKDVRVDTLTSGYWGGRFMQARRVSL
ncbi:C40 family peptidase [Pseudoxanthomonas winnipegensis]|uniref:NlpC/P60 family protein n=1 Tax=Pseudoxanthomonas winnipegensis TaxID=2480810 RepID=A0A4Q8M2V2_9GAMM|nr:NlpC/P60 family protein [Pseudoxanthomonas winnipegensis]